MNKGMALQGIETLIQKRDGIKDIVDYYDSVKKWYENAKLDHR